VIPALVRGVLYALDQGNGGVRWAIRVGIDTTTLPVRLAPISSSPERFLVLGADARTLMAVGAEDGRIQWQQPLSAACLGRPVIVDQRAYVPTYDGRVQEIETASGKLRGYFELRQPLSMGGTWQEGTDLVYFPGDSDNLYVLNIRDKQKRCVAVLHTGHPSGSLRSEPIVVNRTDPFARGNSADQTAFPPYLILSQADGLDQTRLRVFSLPIDRPDPLPLLQPEPRVRGWSWFEPYHDGEKLGFVTDVGVFGLYGINQVRNEDPALFSQFREESALPDSGLALGRAQVVHAVENDFWIAYNGVLQRFHFDLYHQKMMSLWPNPPHVGLPVHAAQLDDQGRTLFLVTQDPLQQTYFASAIEADKGKILWQRQLGLELQGDPLPLSGQVLAVDHGGDLFKLDSAKAPAPQARGWQVLESLAARPLPGDALQSYLLAGPDGGAAYQVSCHWDVSGKQWIMTVRKYPVQAEGAAEAAVEEHFFAVASPFLSAPALTPQSLLWPGADGVVRRVALPISDPPKLEEGPNWRSVRADEGARGYVLAIGPDEFLTTDGSSGLTHWRWPLGMTYSTIPQPVAGEVPAAAELPTRIVAPPVLLPRSTSEGELRVCVATYGGTLTLLAGPELKPVREWQPAGAFTNGLFVRGRHVGCILDQNRLVWIDPNQESIVWDHKFAGAGIVGQPQLVDGLLLVADSSGHLSAFNPETHSQVGSDYLLKTSAAAAGTPVSFGTDTAIVPLTDGTLFLLDLKTFRIGSSLPPGP
jgi:hypothetical protein